VWVQSPADPSQNLSFSQIALTNLAQSMNILSASQTTWSNQQGALANSLNSLNAKQTQVQNQIQNLTDTLQKIGETQQNATEQMTALNNSLNSTVQDMNSQIGELQNDLQTAELGADVDLIEKTGLKSRLKGQILEFVFSLL
jgi:chromosome segregation ATPase